MGMTECGWTWGTSWRGWPDFDIESGLQYLGGLRTQQRWLLGAMCLLTFNVVVGGWWARPVWQAYQARHAEVLHAAEQASVLPVKGAGPPSSRSTLTPLTGVCACPITAMQLAMTLTGEHLARAVQVKAIKPRGQTGSDVSALPATRWQIDAQCRFSQLLRFIKHQQRLKIVSLRVVGLHPPKVEEDGVWLAVSLEMQSCD